MNKEQSDKRSMIYSCADIVFDVAMALQIPVNIKVGFFTSASNDRLRGNEQYRCSIYHYARTSESVSLNPLYGHHHMQVENDNINRMNNLITSRASEQIQSIEVDYTRFGYSLNDYIVNIIDDTYPNVRDLRFHGGMFSAYNTTVQKITTKSAHNQLKFQNARINYDENALLKLSSKVPTSNKLEFLNCRFISEETPGVIRTNLDGTTISNSILELEKLGHANKEIFWTIITDLPF